MSHVGEGDFPYPTTHLPKTRAGASKKIVQVDYSDYEPLSAECNYCHYLREDCECCSNCGFYPCDCSARA